MKIFLLSVITVTGLLLTSCTQKDDPADPGFLLGEIEITLRVGDKLKLSERFDPYDPINPVTVVWFTANPDIVSVSSNGDITAIAAGKTDIFIVAPRSGAVGVCHVTVKDN